MISAAQIRSARALLGISASDLGELANVGWATVQRFEASDGVPASRGGTLERIENALREAGVEFLGDPVASPGVRLKRRAAS